MDLNVNYIIMYILHKLTHITEISEYLSTTMISLNY